MSARDLSHMNKARTSSTGSRAADAAGEEPYLQRFSVSFDYPVHFCRHLFRAANPLLADVVDRYGEGRRHRVQVFIDSGVAQCHPALPGEAEAYCAAYPDRLVLEGAPQIVPGGEAAKNSRAAAEQVMESIADHHLCRQSFVIAVGGGSALDIIGLAASLVHRGLRLVRVPTTVLAQADSGVGVKNGIDAYGMKNFAGTFAPPFAVLNDFAFLPTLDWRYWIGGVAEAFKVAVIRDAEFFAFLADAAPRLRERDETAIETVIRRCARIHLDHIRTAGDPFEFGAARPLDFGHWCAHRLEVLSGYEIGHGQAVAVGIAVDATYACRTGLLPAAELEAVLGAMETCGLPVWAGAMDRRDGDGRPEILAGLAEFREHLGGRLTLTLPAPLGSSTEIHEVDERLVIDIVNALRQRAHRNGSAWHA